MHPPMCSVKLNFNGKSLGNLGWLRIEGTHMDHHGRKVKASLEMLYWV